MKLFWYPIIRKQDYLFTTSRNLNVHRCNVVILFVFDGLTSDVVIRFVDIG